MTSHDDTAVPARSGSPDADACVARSAKGAWWTHVTELQRALVLLNDDRALKGTDWPVLAVIQSRVNDGNLTDARVYREWIAESTGLSVPSVDRSLRRLRENGWVIRTSEGGTRKIDGQMRNFPSVYSLGDGPKIDPATAGDDVIAGEVPITSDRGVAITGEGDPLSPVIDQGVPPSCSPLGDSSSSAAPAAAAPEARKTPPPISIRNNDRPRGKRDWSIVNDDDRLEEFLEDEWGVSPYAPDWEFRQIFDVALDMISRGTHLKAVLNYVEKETKYPHDGTLPPLPGECPHGCTRRQVDGARDRRTGAFRILDATERPARWEDLCVVPCPSCDPQEFAKLPQPATTAPEPDEADIAAILHRVLGQPA